MHEHVQGGVRTANIQKRLFLKSYSLKNTNNRLERMSAQIPLMRFRLADATEPLSEPSGELQANGIK